MSTQLPAPIPLEQVSGQSAVWQFTVTRDGVAVPGVGMTAIFNAVKRVGRAPVLTSEGSSPNVMCSAIDENGVFTVTIPAEATAELSGDHVYQCDVEDGSGDVQRVALGPYSIARNVRDY